MKRFTIDGSPDLDARLGALCGEVTAEIQKIVPAGKLDGLLLGGGYGRGEGGVLKTPAGDAPYNDLEFYVFVSGPVFLSERKYRHAIHALGHRLTETAGLEVEFKILSRAKLRASAPSMFYYDLVVGHRHCLGAQSLLEGCEHHRHADRIPLYEATRLLMNRCSGLLFSKERLARPGFGAQESDFVGRNLAKAQLAFGDAVLAAHGQYHWSCRERQRRLESLDSAEPWLEALRAHHAAGVDFKLHPVRNEQSRETLAARHSELSALGSQLWLWIEGRRLSASFADARAYALSPVNKCPETKAWRNRLIHARAAGLGAAFSPSAARYPRQRLFHSLALLLWDPEALSDARLRAALAAELQIHAPNLAGWVAGYERWWQRFN